jgi:Skp family chaperone for outer membrane proteins
VKKILGVGAILGATLGICMVANNITAQGNGNAAGEPRSKVGLLNLSYVMKNYTKTIALQNEFKELMQPLVVRQKAKQAQMEALVKELQTKPDQRETIEKQLRALKRELEDANNEAQMQLGKKEQELIVVLYKEIQDATGRCALSHGYDVVLHYNDGLTSNDYWNPQNIGSKLQERACLPIFYNKGVEISADVVSVLNTAYAKANPGTVTPTSGVSTPAASGQ